MSALVLTRAEPASYAMLDRLIRQAGDHVRSFEWYWRNHGFGELIIPTLRAWKPSDKVLDAGCGYSPLPRFMAESYGVEMWGADDFGGEGGIWRRGLEPKELSDSPVRMVFEAIGSPQSSLPEGYFDVVYSKLGVHLAQPPQLPIWRHFGSLLNSSPDSTLYVLANIGYATDGDPLGAFDRLDEVTAIEDEVAEQLTRSGRMPEGFWERLEDRMLVRQASGFLYAGLLAEAFGARPTHLPEKLRASAFCCNPEQVVDPQFSGLFQAMFTRDSRRFVEFGYSRRTAVLYQFEREGGSSGL